MNRHLGLYLQLFERTTDLFFTLIEKLFVCLRSHAMQIAQQMKKMVSVHWLVLGVFRLHDG